MTNYEQEECGDNTKIPRHIWRLVFGEQNCGALCDTQEEHINSRLKAICAETDLSTMRRWVSCLRESDRSQPSVHDELCSGRPVAAFNIEHQSYREK
ncbi:hypothetical protein RRG08_046662 [Elysia crispata]|uniref:Uncharacterized protein n=1 Tax=Elysia crispata TaxID=231223 RepID=A0AAE1BDI2_9GAST|nr:hypothetical protein RRG08_046662 [Elysia crispata]